LAQATTTRSRFLEVIAPSRADSAALRQVVASVPFLLVSVLAFTIAQLKVPIPGLWDTIPPWAYGRLRPIAFNAAIWGWATLGYVGAAYYLTPRLTGAGLWGERLANANLWLSVGVYSAGLVAIGAGSTQGRPFAEFPLWLDVLVLVTLAVPALVVTKTVGRRTEESLYVSLWYVLAGVWWLVALYLVGNAPGAGGVADLLQASFFSSGLTGLWLVGMGLGVTYYLLPKVTGSPLYSRPIAVIGFWSLAFAQVWVGPGRWIWGPLPDWSQTVAAVMGLALVLPAAAVVANFVGTLRPRWNMLAESPPLRLALAGSVLYLGVTVLEGVSIFRPMSTVVGLTAWWDGLSAAMLFGASTLWLGAFGIHALPRLIGRSLYRPALALRQMRLTLVGGFLAAGGLLLYGLYAGYTWIGGNQSGAYENTGPGFSETSAAIVPTYLTSAVGGLVLMAAASAYAYNLYRTYTSGRADLQERLVPTEPGDE